MMVDQVNVGKQVDVFWITQTDQRWITGCIKKVHRRDNKKDYVVCHVVYEDGDEERGCVLKECEYGSDWVFNDLREDTHSILSKVLDKLKKTNKILTCIAIANYITLLLVLAVPLCTILSVIYSPVS